VVVPCVIGASRRKEKTKLTRLEAIQPTAAIRGILPDQVVTVVSVQWFGSAALELTYKGASGHVANKPRLQVVESGPPWSFDGDGRLLRRVSEAHRIRLGHLFDPVLAVHTSLVEPLPHQITAVYEAMLPRQPLRFLLADDPGAGKTAPPAPVVEDSGGTTATEVGGSAAPQPTPGPAGTVQPAKPRRYHGTVALDSARVGRDAGRIADEVITHLAGLVGSSVRITLEIEAEIPAGASDNIVRTVAENNRTLKFAATVVFETK
jgi:hypothetical protein